MTRAARAGRIQSVLQTAVFVAFLALPLLDVGLRLDTSKPPLEDESTALPALPADLDALDAWPERFARYWEDHFGWRSWLIRRFHQVNYLLFRVSESREVVVGHDGWLYLGGQAVAYHRGTRPFSDFERRRWLRTLTLRRRWLEERGIRYLFLVAPNKHSIYPEHLPAGLEPVGLASRYRELTRILVEAGVEPLDLHEPLLAAKRRELVYERIGSHWNSRGAYVAYGEILARLTRWFPSLTPVPYERAAMAERGPPGLVRMLALENLLREPRPQPAGGVRFPRLPIRQGGSVVTGQPDATLPRAVVFHDSFAVSLAPYLAEHFSRAAWVWRPRFEGALVRRLRPDVVIEMRAERRLMSPAVPNVFPEESARNRPPP